MEIDTNSNFELLNDHPTVQELSEDEEGLYWSGLQAMGEVIEAVTEYQQQHGEIDLEDPEMKAESEKVQTAVALCELLEEIAAWRRNGIVADTDSKTPSSDPEFDPVGSRTEGERDE